MSDNLKKWKTEESKYLLKDRWITVRADRCTAPDGAVIDPFYVLEYGEWVDCVVISEDNEVTLLKHYRHGIDDFVLEIVGAMVDEGETPEQAMRRELEEEIGLVGAELHQTGICYPNPSHQTNKNYCFIAIGGSFTGKKHLGPGETFQEVKMPLSELKATIQRGDTIFQSLHLSAIFFALNFLEKRKNN